MELKTKYQYTYFIYPFVVEQKEYSNFLSKIFLEGKWEPKIFDKISDEEIYSHFLSVVKDKMFSTFSFKSEDVQRFKKMSIKDKVKKFSNLPSCMFEYKFDVNTKGRLEDETTIFFEITKLKLLCFKEGVCFLLIKAEVEESEYAKFSDILNLNYKFRNITPDAFSLKDYDNIKIQSNRFDTAEDFRKFVKRISFGFAGTSFQDIYSNRMFVYSYTCLDESEWNSIKDFSNVKDAFLKFKYVFSADYNSEFAGGIENENVYSRWKYSIYGFTKMSGVVFSSATDYFNCTKLPFYYENVYLYIMLYAFYQRLSYILLFKEIINSKNKKDIKNKLTELSKVKVLGQVINSEHGMMLWQKWKETFDLDNMYNDLVKQYELM